MLVQARTAAGWRDRTQLRALLGGAHTITYLLLTHAGWPDPANFPYPLDPVGPELYHLLKRFNSRHWEAQCASVHRQHTGNSDLYR